MAKKQGKCINIDCDNYKQIVEIEAGEEFECPLCHQHLEEAGGKGVKDKKKGGGGAGPNWGLIGGIIAALLVVGGIVAFFLLSGDKKPTAIKLDKQKITLKVGETELLTATVEPEGAKATFVWIAKDKSIEVTGGEVKALKKGEAVVTVKVEENPTLRTTCQVIVEEVEDQQPEVAPEEPAVVDEQPEAPAEKAPKQGETKAKESTATSQKPAQSAGYGTVNLGYGTYKGELKNGQPHGHGTITYRRSQRIVSSQDYVAQPGDTFEGEFRDGRINGGIGYWRHDGDITAIRP